MTVGKFILILERLKIAFTANGKREIRVYVYSKNEYMYENSVRMAHGVHTVFSLRRFERYNCIIKRNYIKPLDQQLPLQPKTKAITLANEKDLNSATNQSAFEANACSPRQARENT